MDNGSEPTSRHFLNWGIENLIELACIQPSKPVQKRAHRESPNGHLRDECPNTGYFRNLQEARIRITAWRSEYNQIRPHAAFLPHAPPVCSADACAENEQVSLAHPLNENLGQVRPVRDIPRHREPKSCICIDTYYRLLNRLMTMDIKKVNMTSLLTRIAVRYQPG